MLKPAQSYEEELKKLFISVMYEEKYMYYFMGWNETYECDKNNWNTHEFVSVDKEGNVLGYISYNVNQRSDNASSLSIINFGDNKIIFGKDVFKAILDIFKKYRYNKLTYSVHIGNPIEKTYDKLTKKYGGRIVGIYEKETKLLDGKFYDLKLYEMLKENVGG